MLLEEELQNIHFMFQQIRELITQNYRSVYPCPNTLSSTVGAFKYQEGNDISDHPVLLHGTNAGAQSPQNYPTIGGTAMEKFSSFPGELKNFVGGQDSVGADILYISQLPVIGRAESWTYSGTWNFAQYSFSHQNYYAGRTGDGVGPGGGHNYLIPLDTYNNPYATNIHNDDIIKYWFDLESRPAIHSFCGRHKCIKRAVLVERKRSLVLEPTH